MTIGRGRWGALALCASGCAGGSGADLDLPEVVASSRYVDFATASDPAGVCMDDELARWDAYLDEVAEFLQSGELSFEHRIRYTWVPDWHEAENPAWVCLHEYDGCAYYDKASATDYNFARPLIALHELTHSADRVLLGKAHFALEEGLADYLSIGGGSIDDREGYPAGFREIVALGPRPQVYTYLAHFVGATIERHGLDKYLELRERVPVDADLAEFEAAYAEVFGVDLDDALIEIANTTLTRARPPRGCGDDDAVESIAWTAPGEVQTTLTGACGDLAYLSGGVEFGGYLKTYTFEVTERGAYELAIVGSEGTTLEIRGCPGVDPDGIQSVSGEAPVSGVLEAGRHVAYAFFARSPDALSISLTLLSPLPP